MSKSKSTAAAAAAKARKAAFNVTRAERKAAADAAYELEIRRLRRWIVRQCKKGWTK